LCSLGCSPVFADQAAYDLAALDLGSHVDGVTGWVLRGSLVRRLMRPMTVVMPRELGQDLPEVLRAEDQQVIKALAAKRAHESFRK
jgi:hypothetical protein